MPKYYLRGDPVCDQFFLSKQAETFADREWAQGPIEIQRGLFSDDPRLIRMKQGFAKKWTAEFFDPSNIDQDGRVLGNGVRNNAYGLLYVPGYPMYPATYPMYSNRYRREEEGLSNKPVAQWHEWMFRAMIQLMFSDLQPERLRIKADSSSCSPFFETKAHRKNEMILNLLSDHVVADVARMVTKKQWKELYDVHRVGAPYVGVYREQMSDKISIVEKKEGLSTKLVFEPKVRKVAPFTHAISSGKEGSLIEANRTLKEEDGVPYFNESFRTRRRTAYGCSLGVNAYLLPIAQSVRSHLYEAYSWSFHHTTRAQKQEKVRANEYAIFVDVSDHDLLWPNGMYSKIIESELKAMGFAPWWVDLLVLSLHLPIYISSPAPGEGHVIIGDPENPDLEAGLPSGNAFTDLFGTFGMAPIYAMIQIEQTAPWLIESFTSLEAVKGFLHDYLRGALPFSACSKSDDGMMLWKSGRSAELAVNLQAKMVAGEQLSKYMHVSYEHGGKMLGDILLYGSDKTTKNSFFIGDITSFFTNLLAPEYSCNSKERDRTRVRRPYPGLAYDTASQVYGSCPAYAGTLDMLEFFYRKEFGDSFEATRVAWRDYDRQLLAAWLQAQKIKFKWDDLSPIEQEVFASRDKIQWKYSPDLIREELRELILPGISLEYIQPYFQSIVPR